MLNNPLDEPINNVEPLLLEYLNNKCNIYTYKELITLYPIRYINKSKFWKISELTHLQNEVQIIGKIKNIEIIRGKQTQRLIAYFYDETGVIDLIWFKKIEIIKKIIKINIPLIIFGRIRISFNRIQIIHPQIEINYNYYQTNLLPIYSINNKLQKIGIKYQIIINLFQRIIHKIKKIDISENIPTEILTKYNIISKKESLIQIHFPDSVTRLFQAQKRIKFEKFFFYKLHLLNKNYYNGYSCLRIGNYFNKFYKYFLPFELTNAQKNVIKKIRYDLGQYVQMNRIIQGDVGSGKTIVGLMSILIALDNGFQACLITPTEILAQQHYETIKKLFGPMNIKFEILTGSTNKVKYNKISDDIASGKISILIGTHTLIEEKIHFKNLGLVIIDEQHRFGVAQRAKFWKKNKNPPHILAMTATPIPRTLQMTLYKGLDISIIDEYPSGRKPIKTIHCYEKNKFKIFNFIKSEIKKGRQIFIVYPLIHASNKDNYNYLFNGYQEIQKQYPEYKISILHGQMNTINKKHELQRFFNQETHIMISTTIIEVGIDIPNASVILIENADHFGLSQLHQLRGRVGRSKNQSYCILMTKNQINKKAKQRIISMCSTNNGFKIAEEDLKLRGPGDIMGTKQSGIIKKRFSYQDIEIIQAAYNAVIELLKNNPNILYDKKIQNNQIYWNKIS